MLVVVFSFCFFWPAHTHSVQAYFLDSLSHYFFFFEHWRLFQAINIHLCTLLTSVRQLSTNLVYKNHSSMPAAGECNWWMYISRKLPHSVSVCSGVLTIKYFEVEFTFNGSSWFFPAELNMKTCDSLEITITFASAWTLTESSIHLRVRCNAMSCKISTSKYTLLLFIEYVVKETPVIPQPSSYLQLQCGMNTYSMIVNT